MAEKKRANPWRWLVLLVLVGGVVWALASGATSVLTLENLKARQADLAAWGAANPWRAAGLFFLTYVAVAAASIPGAAVMTLGAGALFGVGEGVLLVSFASAIGASLAFLVARFVLRATACVRATASDSPRSTPASSATVPSTCLLYTSPSPRDGLLSRMPSSA